MQGLEVAEAVGAQRQIQHLLQSIQVLLLIIQHQHQAFVNQVLDPLHLAIAVFLGLLYLVEVR